MTTRSTQSVNSGSFLPTPPDSDQTPVSILQPMDYFQSSALPGNMRHAWRQSYAGWIELCPLHNVTGPWNPAQSYMGS